MKLELRFPANAESAAEHAALAAELFRQEFDRELDFSPGSLETVDEQIESLREEGYSAEDVAETLFVLGCYLGEVLARAVRGRWSATQRTALAPLSPWPMVVVLADGSAWDAIGKVYRRFEIGDSEYLPAFFASAANHGPAGRRF
jgi:hypothetical protein